MAISDDDVQKIKEATDIVSVVSQYVTLKKVGMRWAGLCPFHTEKTGSFSVNAEEGLVVGERASTFRICPRRSYGAHSATREVGPSSPLLCGECVCVRLLYCNCMQAG